MDRHGFGILTWKHVGTQKISTQNSKLVVSHRSLYAFPEVGVHNYVSPAATEWIYEPVGLIRAGFSAVGLFLGRKSKNSHE